MPSATSVAAALSSEVLAELGLRLPEIARIFITYLSWFLQLFTVSLHNSKILVDFIF
jgi:hypothetical protein